MSEHKTILVVNDNKANIDVVLGLLEDYDLLVAQDGPSALDILKEEIVDLILLDIMMPGNGGFQICRELKKNRETRDIPVIFITAKSDELSIEKGYEIGGEDYVTKPFKPRELRARIKNQLDHRELVQKLARSEDKYRSMMEAMADPVYICGQDFRIEYMNPVMLKRTGRDATGEFCYKALHGFDEACSWCRSTASERGKSFEIDILSPQDNHSYHLVFAPIARSDGTISEMVIFRDTTQLKKLEEQLRQAQKMEAMGTLAAGIAHDFNNLLTGVIAFAVFAQGHSPAGCEAYADLDEVLTGLHKMAFLVSQILAFSRKGVFPVRALEPSLVVKQALAEIRLTLPASIKLILDIDPRCGEIEADSKQIHNTVAQLCKNALQAMDFANGILAIKLQRQKVSAIEVAGEPDVEAGDFVVLRVSDTGCGMDKETIAHIFEPYFTTRDVGQGSGLGLAVMHGVVKRSHGFVRVVSEPGKGSTFSIFMPALEKVETLKIDEKKPLATGTERILVADEEGMIARMNKAVLGRLGYEVTAVTASSEVLELIRKEPDHFDLLLISQNLAPLSGSELACAALKIKPEMLIVLGVDYSSTITEKETLAIGIKKYVQKPLDRTALARIVRQVLDAN